jgi:hypothetical protein
MDYKTMKFADVVEWCKANNQIKWLKEYKEANPNLSFLALKKAFAIKFMPEIIPTATAKKQPTMAEIIDAL